MTVRMDSRQSRQLSALDQLSNSTGLRLDVLLNLINSELTMPLRLKADATPSLNLNIGAIEITTTDSSSGTTQGTSRNRTIQPIQGQLPTFTPGYVTFPSTSGGSITSSGFTLQTSYTLTVSSGNYIKVLFALTSTGQIALSFGVQGASAAAATMPVAQTNAYAIGYVVLQNVAGTIQSVTDANIHQFMGGGGAGGSGTGNPILETVKNTLGASVYNLVTPNIFSVNLTNLVDGTSTGSYSYITNSYTLPSVGNKYVSKQMLDANEFLGQNLDVNKVMLQTMWTAGSVDAAATYEVSRDGGANWKTVTMSRIGNATDTFSGEYTWTSEDTAVSKGTAGGTGATTSLNQTTAARIAGPISLTSATLNAAVRQVQFTLAKTGSPTGYLYASIVRLSGSLPSTDPADVLASSGPFDMSTLTGSATAYTFNLGPAILNAGTSYAVVLRADYGSFSAGVNEVVVTRAASGTTGQLYNASTGVWSTGTISVPQITILGRDLDLRARITSGTSNVSIDGVAVYYYPTFSGISTSGKKLDVKQFLSTANTNSFTIGFLPDPDLLTVYYVEGGQAFRFGAFSLNGYTVTFPVNSFNNGGVTSTVTLVFDQSGKGSFDNSDANAALLASNNLGSTSASLDKSVSGQGIFLRNAAGNLRQIALDSSDNIIISSVP
jgi:hypothetical protein